MGDAAIDLWERRLQIQRMALFRCQPLRSLSPAAFSRALGWRAPAMGNAVRALWVAAGRRRWPRALPERAREALDRMAVRLELRPGAPGRLLLSLEAAYALTAKLLAWHLAAGIEAGATTEETLGRLESGERLAAAGIEPAPADRHGWYLAVWDPPLAPALTGLAEAVGGFDPASAERLADSDCDLLGELYGQLLPRPVRHALGETYTPGWLAARTAEATLAGLERPRVLDPACGSGAFLGVLIRRARGASPEATAEELLAGVAGIDLNPLAVLAARTTCLLALGDSLQRRSGRLALPVVAGDTIRLPWEEPGALPPPLRQPFDAIVGNPPWVNWEHLGAGQRRATGKLWRRYGLFPERGQGLRTILGGAKYDLAMLLTCRVADRALRPGGRLGLVLNRSLFKTAGAGLGFRRFRLPDGTPLAPLSIDDVTALHPFPGLPVQPAIAVFEKGTPVRYPAPWRVWERLEGPPAEWVAEPVDPADATSAWLSGPPGELRAIRRVLGVSAYTAREGTNTGGANGILWLRAGAVRADGLLEVANLPARARRPTAPAAGAVEAELVYPLLRGQDVRRWRAEPSLHILLPHLPGQRLKAIPEAELRERFPGAAAYLEGFRRELAGRPLRRRYFREGSPFYAMFNVGDYTFAADKVVWREQGTRWAAAVVGLRDGRPIVPDHKLMQVAVATPEEAHYLCAALNSPPVDAAVRAYTQTTARSTHILDHVAIPRYDPANPVHRELAEVSMAAHAGRIEGLEERLAAAAGRLDRPTMRPG